MKKAIGVILCVVAVLAIVAEIIRPKRDSMVEKIGVWGVITVILTVGVYLSEKPKPKP